MKRVVITGGASGMGLAATKLFLERGWKVVAVDMNEEKGNAVVAELEGQGYKDKIFFSKCNVASHEDAKKLFDFVMEKMGGTDSLINNAGIWVGGELHETADADWDKIFLVDVKSIFVMCKAFVPYMIENGGGSIVNTASNSGLLGDYSMAAYNAAKGAVENIVRSMALDYGKYNIRVNNVCPGATKTPMFLGNPPEVQEMFNKSNPMGRIATPEDIAKAMYFLASDEASFCNGVNLPVDGGISVHTGQPFQDSH